MQTTRVKDSKHISLGLAEIFIADSDTHISSTDSVLVSSDYFSAMTEVSFKIDREFIPVSDTIEDVIVLLDKILIKSALVINATFVELSGETLALAGGGEGNEANILNALFSQPKNKRVELIFTYPNKVDTMTLILPNAKIITQSLGGAFKSSDAFSAPISIVSMKTVNASWTTNPMGKLEFSS